MVPRDPASWCSHLCVILPLVVGADLRSYFPTNRTWQKWRMSLLRLGYKKPVASSLDSVPPLLPSPLLPLPIFVVMIIFHTMRTLRQPARGLLPTAPWVSLEGIFNPSCTLKWQFDGISSERSWARGTWLHCAQVLDLQKPWENN